MWFSRRVRWDRPRRIYYNKRSGLGNGHITGYLSIDEWRSGDYWHESRDRLRKVVHSQLLVEASLFTIGPISFHEVWASIIPSVCPSHWITAGFRSNVTKKNIPIIQIPVCIGSTDDSIRVGGSVFFAIDALQLPVSLNVSKRDRAVFSFTLLSALSIVVRDQMRDRRLK